MDLFKKNQRLILSEEALFSGKRKRSSVRPKDKIYATINGIPQEIELKE